MVSYDIFGQFYDAAMDRRAAQAAYIHSLIAQHRPGAKTLLELACGTGAILEFLSTTYEVSGLDLSTKMLSVARKKLPRASFFHGNMAIFALDRRFDVIICVFDSINHLLRFTEWRRMFRQVHAHLEEQGVFVFDMNPERKLQRLIQAPPFVKTFADHLMIMEVTDAGKGIANWNIKVFAPRTNAIYELFEENIKERSFPVRQVKAALLEQFSAVKMFDPARRRSSAQSDRVYFVCQR